MRRGGPEAVRCAELEPFNHQFQRIRELHWTASQPENNAVRIALRILSVLQAEFYQHPWGSEDMGQRFRGRRGFNQHLLAGGHNREGNCEVV